MEEGEDLSAYIVTGSAGDLIFEEGEEGGGMFLVQEGEVELLCAGPAGPHVVAVRTPGEFFGERAVFEKSPRDMSARARTDCKLIKVDQPAFERIIRENPGIAVSMLRQLVRRRREMDAVAPAGGESPDATAGPGTAAGGADAATARDRGGAASPAARGQAVLIHEPSATEFALDPGGECIVGRPDPAAGFVPDVDLARFDTSRSLSRRHARLLFKAGSYYVREEAGTNGTFVNNVRVKGGLTVKLSDGDQIRFGLVQTLFRLR
jgi:hypothetical protein